MEKVNSVPGMVLTETEVERTQRETKGTKGERRFLLSFQALLPLSEKSSSEIECSPYSDSCAEDRAERMSGATRIIEIPFPIPTSSV